MDVADCVFCRRLAVLEALPAGEVVWRFPHSVAFLGAWQFYHGYCTLVSRTHATELHHLPDSERRAYLDEMCLLAGAVEAYARPHKLNYELLGNLVPHLHWHIFPRSAQDPDALKPVWLALDRAEHDSELRRRYETGPRPRESIAAGIRQHLVALGAPGS
jgi:diadenosine tetraphosphate (Ap4A) HIT family hydrolase